MAPKVSRPNKAQKVAATDTAIDTSIAALRTILFFSLGMVFVPAVVFLASQEGYLDALYKHTIGVPRPDKRILVSGVLAVFAVNCVIAAFVVVAFREEVPPLKTESKKDK